MSEERAANKILYNKHPKRRNNNVVAAMYAMYQTGKSLEDVGEVYRKTRQAVYDLFRSRHYKLRTKELKGLTIVDGISFTLTKGGYLRGTVLKNRVLLHWYIWGKANGKVPEGYCLHHIDGNPANNLLENLELVARKKMGIRFGQGRNQYSKLSTD